MPTSKFTAIVGAKCPKCRRGRIFKGATYSLSTRKINEKCPHCGLRFEVEPGYFYAAMYVSYAMNVAQGVGLALLTYLLTGELESPFIYLIVVLGGCVLLMPFNFRYSRVILLHWLSPKIKYVVSYDHD